MSPAELLIGRQPQTRLDLLKPNTADRVESKQQQQQSNHYGSAQDRKFALADSLRQEFWSGSTMVSSFSGIRTIFAF